MFFRGIYYNGVEEIAIVMECEIDKLICDNEIRFDGKKFMYYFLKFDDEYIISAMEQLGFIKRIIYVFFPKMIKKRFFVVTNKN